MLHGLCIYGRDKKGRSGEGMAYKRETIPKKRDDAKACYWILKENSGRRCGASPPMGSLPFGPAADREGLKKIKIFVK